MRSIGVDQIRSRDFWARECPGLTLSGSSLKSEGDFADAGRWRELDARMEEDGYFQDAHPALARRAPALAGAVARLVAMELPPTFLFLFEEAWDCFRILLPILSHFLGDVGIIPAIWAWHVDPCKEEAGWKPHRDRTKRSLADDGRPQSLSIWIPLTEATPLNGCMYVIPAGRDPAYNTTAQDRFGFVPVDYRLIRALPAKPGDFLCWNQALLHWGGKSSRFAPNPRMSMSIEFQRSDIAPFQGSVVDPFESLSFARKIELIAEQILKYRHMAEVPENIAALAQTLLRV
jgi:ectoine hydroxylase-related dioxygenase (phytanoyl-CoA dioxygenase family)